MKFRDPSQGDRSRTGGRRQRRPGGDPQPTGGEGDGRFYQSRIVTARFFTDDLLSQAAGYRAAIVGVLVLVLAEDQFRVRGSSPKWEMTAAARQLFPGMVTAASVAKAHHFGATLILAGNGWAL